MLWLLFGHSAKSSTASTLIGDKVPHVVSVRLHVLKSNAVILTRETVVIIGVRAVAYPIHPGRSHGCRPARYHADVIYLLP